VSWQKQADFPDISQLLKNYFEKHKMGERKVKT